MHGRRRADLRAFFPFHPCLPESMYSLFRPAMLQSASATLSSLASLSLSGTPPPQSIPQTGTSFTSASGMITSSSYAPVPKIETRDDDVVPDEASAAPPLKTEISGAGISVTKTGKKRGTIFKCESCSKVRGFHRMRLQPQPVAGGIARLTHARLSGLPTPFLLDQAPLGTFSSLARSLQVLA